MRACHDTIGAFALCFAHRGHDRKVTTDFEVRSEYCIGCGSCTQVCPTGAIWMKDDCAERIIYTKDVMVAKFQLETRKSCGTPYAPKQYLDYIVQHSDIAISSDVERGICPVCARSQNAARIAGQAWTC